MAEAWSPPGGDGFCYVFRFCVDDVAFVGIDTVAYTQTESAGGSAGPGGSLMPATASLSCSERFSRGAKTRQCELTFSVATDVKRH